MNSIIQELIRKRAEALMPYDRTKRSKIDEERQFEEDIRRQERKDSIAFKRGTESLDDKRKRRRVDTLISKYVDTIQRKANAQQLPISELKLLQRVIERDIVPSDSVIDKVNRVIGSIDFDDIRGRPQDVVNAVRVANDVLSGLFTDRRMKPTSSLDNVLKKLDLEGVDLRDLDEEQLREVLKELGDDAGIDREELINIFSKIRGKDKIGTIRDYFNLDKKATRQEIKDFISNPEVQEKDIVNAFAEAQVRDFETMTEDLLLERLENFLEQQTEKKQEEKQNKILDKQLAEQIRIGESKKRRAKTEAERKRIEKQIAETRTRAEMDRRRRQEAERQKQAYIRQLQDAPDANARKRRAFDLMGSKFDRMKTPLNDALEDFRNLEYRNMRGYLKDNYGINYTQNVSKQQMETDLINQLRRKSQPRQQARRELMDLGSRAVLRESEDKDKDEFQMTQSPLFRRSRSRLGTEEGDSDDDGRGKGASIRRLDREAERQLRARASEPGAGADESQEQEEQEDDEYDQEELDLAAQAQQQTGDEEEEGSGASYKQYRKLVNWFDREIERRLL